ncbi:MAG: Nif3-like dinuclear metal center hexameric protein [Rikenellaceae bacterium]
MIQIGEIVASIEEVAPLSLQESWDNCGMQVCGAHLSQTIDSVVVALDPTMEVLQKAIEIGSKMVITHHPLMLNGIRSVTRSTPTGEIVIEALHHGITIYSSHTAFDSAEGGINDYLAKSLQLSNIELLDAGGLGRVGDLRCPMQVGDFARLLKEKFALPTIRTNATIDDKVFRVALCGGSGGSLISQAIASGADTYLCGDLKYHNFDTHGGLKLFDIGHFESENQFISLISDIISKKFPNFAVHTMNSNYTTFL